MSYFLFGVSILKVTTSVCVQAFGTHISSHFSRDQYQSADAQSYVSTLHVQFLETTKMFFQSD